jgi:Ca-activated chloride channel family protein
MSRGVADLRLKEPEFDGESFEAADPDTRFAAAVAAFGMLLRDSPHKGQMTWAGVERVAREAVAGREEPRPVPMAGGEDLRKQFLDLVRRARELAGEP